MVALECQNNPYLSSEGLADVLGRYGLACRRGDHRHRGESASARDSVLKQNEGALHKLADFLLERETITGEEFKDLIKQITAAQPA
jgi:cell division protease FtsH